MEYLGFLLVGVAAAGVGLRGYFSLTRDSAAHADKQRGTNRRTAARRKRAHEAKLARRLLRYHLGLSHG